MQFPDTIQRNVEQLTSYCDQAKLIDLGHHKLLVSNMGSHPQKETRRRDRLGPLDHLLLLLMHYIGHLAMFEFALDSLELLTK